MADFTKTVAAVLDFTLDWTSYLDGTDTIVSSAWTVPSGILSSSPSSTATSTSIRLSSGKAGLFYFLVNTITTASGQIDEQPLIITIST